MLGRYPPRTFFEPRRSGGLQRGTWSEVVKAEARMRRRPLDRRSFRDACAAARLRVWPPENVSMVASIEELLVWRPISSRVACVKDGGSMVH